jgi:hypothetical protein
MTESEVSERLASFLRRDANTVTRERLLFHCFCFDTCLAAARASYPLAVLSIEVDREGFDVVLDDGDRERRVQLKVVDGTTGSWSVPKRLIRPEMPVAARLGFRDTMEGIGIGGAIVLMEYDTATPALDVRYLFCDAHILAARAHGWINANGMPGSPSKVAQKKVDELQTGIGSEQIELSKGLFIKSRGPNHLLTLLELHSIEDNQWCEMLRTRLGVDYAVNTHGRMEDIIAEAILKLADL